MATFDEILRKSNAMASRISAVTGVPKQMARNIVQYCKCLPSPSNPDVIDDLIFYAQMGVRFGITSKYHVQLMLEAIRTPKSRFVKLEDYAQMVCTFASSNLDVKIDFVFNVYNFNRSGFIQFKEIGQLLKNAIVPFGEDDTNEQLKEMIEMVIGVVDSNQDGLLSLEEFRTYVKRNTLCLELFGKVMPNDKNINSFLYILQKRSAHEIKEFFKNERKQCLAEPNIRKETEEDSLFQGVVLDMV